MTISFKGMHGLVSSFLGRRMKPSMENGGQTCGGGDVVHALNFETAEK